MRGGGGGSLPPSLAVCALGAGSSPRAADAGTGAGLPGPSRDGVVWEGFSGARPRGEGCGLVRETGRGASAERLRPSHAEVLAAAAPEGGAVLFPFLYLDAFDYPDFLGLSRAAQ